MSIRPARLRAFTLVELLMAVSLAVMVGMVVYKTLAGGIAIWKRSSEYRVRGDVMIFYNKAAGDLANNCTFSTYNFYGDQNGISFFVHDPDYMMLSDKDISSSGKRGAAAIYKVEYAYNPQSGQIKRTTCTIAGRKPETETTALSGVSDCVFEYYVWDNDTRGLMRAGSVSGRSPDGVSISLKLKNGKDEYEIIKKVIEVPAIV